MAISDNYIPLKELGNGVTVEFSDTWAVLSASFLRVFLEDVTTGVQTPVDEGGAADEYTLTFDSSGFVVTFNTAPTSANFVVIAREVAEDQTSPYRTSKGFQGEVLENSLDKLTAIDQDQSDEIDRSLKFQLGSALIGILPVPVDDLYMGWSGTTGTIKNSVKTITEVEAAVDLVEAVTTGSGVLVSGTDTLIGFLSTKLVDGTSVNFTINNGGGVETMTIDVPAASETVVGAVEAATTAEMTAGTADKFPDAAKVKAFVGKVILGHKYVSTGATSSTTSTIPTDDTIPQISEGAEAATLTYTRVSSTSRLYVSAGATISGSTARTVYPLTLFDGSTDAVAITGQAILQSGAFINPVIGHSQLSASTGAITFSTRFGNNGSGTAFLNGNAGGREWGGVSNTFIEIWEIEE